MSPAREPAAMLTTYLSLNPDDQENLADAWEDLIARKRAKRGPFGRFFGGPLGVGLGWPALIGLILQLIALLLGRRMQADVSDLPAASQFDPDVLDVCARFDAVAPREP